MNFGERTNSAQELRDMANRPPRPLEIPTCGRIVQYHCVDDVMQHTNPQYCKGIFPAIVIEASDLNANLVVFNLVDGCPAVTRLSVPHKAISQSDYWDWPIKK